MKLTTKMGLISLTMSSVILTACTNTISHNINNDGTIANTSDVIFPSLDKAWQKEGQFPNSENLSKIKPGIAKDELYQLIGRPHFSEGQHAHEWDYIMKFYTADNAVKICQYKVIFDDKYKGQEFYWLPADCAQYAQPKTPVVITAPVISEKINLSADALFHFDKWQPEQILPKGKMELDALAQKLKTYQTRGRTQIILTGHTDYLGGDAYNMDLSLLRAQTVRSYLISQGVDASSLVASGAGESQPIKQCSENQPRAQLIDCLQPNRRVEVNVSVYQ